MALSVHGLADALQTLLTDVADKAARDTGFSVRKRKITGAGFVQALVLGWLNRPRATLDDLTIPLGVTVQSLHQRFNARAVACLHRVLAAMLELLFEARPEAIPLLRRFPEVCVEDATSIALPASLADAFPGCGGAEGTGRAGLKLLVQLEALAGRVRVVGPVAARVSDRALHPELPAPPRGSLLLLDLGFFDLRRMKRDTERGTFWISRVPTRLTVRGAGEPPSDLAGWLDRCKGDRIDAMVILGTGEQLACRLVAVRVPKDVAELRLKRLKKKLKKKGRKLSRAQRVLCEWTVMVTNLDDPELFTAEELWVLYRVRWQVELLFKRWKSDGGLAFSRGRSSPNRALCEFLAKLMAVLIKHWATLLRGGPLHAVSAARAGARVVYWAGQLAAAVRSGGLEAIEKLLSELKASLDRLPNRPDRARQTTRQTLFEPRFVS